MPTTLAVWNTAASLEAAPDHVLQEGAAILRRADCVKVLHEEKGMPLELAASLSLAWDRVQEARLGPAVQRAIRKVKGGELRYRLELAGHDDLDDFVDDRDLADYAIAMIQQGDLGVDDILESVEESCRCGGSCAPCQVDESAHAELDEAGLLRRALKSVIKGTAKLGAKAAVGTAKLGAKAAVGGAKLAVKGAKAAVRGAKAHAQGRAQDRARGGQIRQSNRGRANLAKTTAAAKTRRAASQQGMSKEQAAGQRMSKRARAGKASTQAGKRRTASRGRASANRTRARLGASATWGKPGAGLMEGYLEYREWKRNGIVPEPYDRVETSIWGHGGVEISKVGRDGVIKWRAGNATGHFDIKSLLYDEDTEEWLLDDSVVGPGAGLMEAVNAQQVFQLVQFDLEKAQRLGDRVYSALLNAWDDAFGIWSSVPGGFGGASARDVANAMSRFGFASLGDFSPSHGWEHPELRRAWPKSWPTALPRKRGLGASWGKPGAGLMEGDSRIPIGPGATSKDEIRNRIVMAISHIMKYPTHVGLPTAGMLGPVVRSLRGHKAEREWHRGRRKPAEIIAMGQALAAEAGVILPSGLAEAGPPKHRRGELLGEAFDAPSALRALQANMTDPQAWVAAVRAARESRMMIVARHYLGYMGSRDYYIAMPGPRFMGAWVQPRDNRTGQATGKAAREDVFLKGGGKYDARVGKGEPLAQGTLSGDRPLSGMDAIKMPAAARRGFGQLAELEPGLRRQLNHPVLEQNRLQPGNTTLNDLEMVAAAAAKHKIKGVGPLLKALLPAARAHAKMLDDKRAAREAGQAIRPPRDTRWPNLGLRLEPEIPGLYAKFAKLSRYRGFPLAEGESVEMCCGDPSHDLVSYMKKRLGLGESWGRPGELAEAGPFSMTNLYFGNFPPDKANVKDQAPLTVEPATIVYGKARDGRRPVMAQFTGTNAKKEAETYLKGLGLKKSGNDFVPSAAEVKKKEKEVKKALSVKDKAKSQAEDDWGGPEAVLKAQRGLRRLAGRGDADRVEWDPARSSEMQISWRDDSIPRDTYGDSEMDIDDAVERVGKKAVADAERSGDFPSGTQFSYWGEEKSYISFSATPPGTVQRKKRDVVKQQKVRVKAAQASALARTGRSPEGKAAEQMVKDVRKALGKGYDVDFEENRVGRDEGAVTEVTVWPSPRPHDGKGPLVMWKSADPRYRGDKSTIRVARKKGESRWDAVAIPGLYQPGLKELIAAVKEYMPLGKQKATKKETRVEFVARIKDLAGYGNYVEDQGKDGLLITPSEGNAHNLVRDLTGKLKLAGVAFQAASEMRGTGFNRREVQQFRVPIPKGVTGSAPSSARKAAPKPAATKPKAAAEPVRVTGTPLTYTGGSTSGGRTAGLKMGDRAPRGMKKKGFAIELTQAGRKRYLSVSGRRTPPQVEIVDLADASLWRHSGKAGAKPWFDALNGPNVKDFIRLPGRQAWVSPMNLKLVPVFVPEANESMLRESTEELPDGAAAALERAVPMKLKRLGYDLRLAGPARLAKNRLSWTAVMTPNTGSGLPKGRYVFSVGRPNRVSPWFAELTYATANATPQPAVKGASRNSVNDALKDMHDVAELAGSRAVPSNLRVGARVRGEYHGVAFTGKIGRSPVGGISVELDAPIKVLGQERDGLWFDPRGSVFQGNHYFELAESLAEAVLPTENEGWGFYGTMIIAGIPRSLTQTAWEVASEALLPHVGDAAAVRRLLDSRWGRHFADSVTDNGGASTMQRSPGTVAGLVRQAVADYARKGWLRAGKLRRYMSESRQLREGAAERWASAAQAELGPGYVVKPRGQSEIVISRAGDESQWIRAETRGRVWHFRAQSGGSRGDDLGRSVALSVVLDKARAALGESWGRRGAGAGQLAETDERVRELERAYHEAPGDSSAAAAYFAAAYRATPRDWAIQQGYRRYVLNPEGQALPGDVWVKDVAKAAARYLRQASSYFDRAGAAAQATIDAHPDPENGLRSGFYNDVAVSADMAKAARSMAAKLSRWALPRVSMGGTVVADRMRAKAEPFPDIRARLDSDPRAGFRHAGRLANDAASLMRSVASTVEDRLGKRAGNAAYAATSPLDYLSSAANNQADPYGGSSNSDQWKRPLQTPALT